MAKRRKRNVGGGHPDPPPQRRDHSPPGPAHPFEDRTSAHSDLELSGRDGHCSVGEGCVEPYVTNQVRPPPSATGAERTIQAVEERLRLLSALDGANRGLRHAVASCQSEGATLRELADLMGVSAQAVHKHWLTTWSRPGIET